MKKSFIIVIPIIVAIIFISIFNLIVNREIEQLKSSKDLATIKHAYGGDIKKNGVEFRDISLENNDLMLLGSSELNNPVPQNPVNLFPFNDSKYDISIFGSAHVQDLQHAIMLGGGDNYNNSKVALVASLQWFWNKDGIGSEKFIPLFSDLQFYQFLNNPKISKENKTYLAKRVAALLKDSDIYQEERVYAELFIGETFIDKVKYNCLLPYFKTKQKLLETRDKIALLKEMKSLPDKSNVNTVKSIDFKEQYKIAESQGMEKVSNNMFNASDEYYNKYLKDKESSLKNAYKDIDILDSAEFEDFKFLLSVCKDLGIKPYIILMNVNGWYYDYTGILEEERTQFYNKLESIAKDNNFDVLNLQKHEYEKYYLTDVMHLGWKGWLNVSEEMSNHFKD